MILSLERTAGHDNGVKVILKSFSGFDVKPSRLTNSYMGRLIPRKGDIDVNAASRIGP